MAESTTPTCELCGCADAEGIWFAVHLCGDCLTSVAERADTGQCVCWACLQHDQEVQP
jgi:hypothetical protein